MARYTRAGVVYAAVVLGKKSRMRLLAWWTRSIGQPLPILFAHHMTIAFDPTQRQLARLLLGRTVEVKVVGWAADDRAQAVAVASRVPSISRVPHITVATAEGTPPAYSNELLARGYRRVVGPLLTGTVTAVQSD